VKISINDNQCYFETVKLFEHNVIYHYLWVWWRSTNFYFIILCSTTT